jgi:hypothetical protein
MPLNKVSQRGRQLVEGTRLRQAWPVLASLAVLWLVSCKPPVSTPPATPVLPFLEVTVPPTPGSPGPEVIASPTATLEPIPSPIIEETVTSQPEPLAIAPLKSDEVGRFELLELEIQTVITASNPFNPEELDIRVAFTSPSGKTAEVGAFWYQGFDPAGKFPKGEPGWRARFSPTEAGAWTAIARIPARGLQSEPVTFRTVPTDNPGFVRVHPDNPRYLAFDNGELFFPIGLNMAWWSGAGDALTDYRKWMDPFAANGGNAIRVWMAEWSFGIEWKNAPLGDYSSRLRRAWLLDQIFAMAEERDVYVLLVLLNCADFNNWQTNGWNGNPYNAALGGPLERPEQFATDPTARAFLQRRLNYIVNRWGYSPHLLAWEWWNEVNLTPISDEALIPWLQEMTAYLRERDVNRHLVTNSFAISDTSPIWAMPEMEIIQKHEYALQENTPHKDLAERAAADLGTLVGIAPPKPALLGEFGYGDEGYGNDVDRTGIHLHNGIWATTFVGYAGSGMYWFWDVYVEAYRAWHHFRGLQRFLVDVDLSRYQPFSQLEISGPAGELGQAVGLGLRGDEDVLIWLRSDAYTVQAVEAAWQAAGSPATFTYQPPLVEGQVLTLPHMIDGPYTIHWYEPQRGDWLEPAEATAQGDRLTIPIPDFRRDLAARIVPNR